MICFGCDLFLNGLFYAITEESCKHEPRSINDISITTSVFYRSIPSWQWIELDRNKGTKHESLKRSEICQPTTERRDVFQSWFSMCLGRGFLTNPHLLLLKKYLLK
ncbi:hypothetical protein FVEG_14703 [Fusarium verticillioides 7600]|uniref:Uncharacterized protein n=1 Tax=Gibberella moniliformis (strain M3125 / FGSC 7600) TaxID=334819 RepID=W7LDS4_GIBM7|nr:hypothetical protein FVEG_14703 [Fusarium verticillioides 7600]XP_018742918.1 hypothetical protein FVEG_14703 [Fusarium verticillioides 7600]EWG36726.1 hypothetical protein FVEG_14703 [Fusarium verticillioides 7600]EWG36727.1 hypothetical protein FVEG_14703 [Fusarium verticillioides 7600]